LKNNSQKRTIFWVVNEGFAWEKEKHVFNIKVLKKIMNAVMA
jgi:hypothetical protein